jgi:ribosome-associated heat shock protein Hsp15
MTERVRIDKWLWHARFYKSRALASEAAASGLIRLNGARVEKPGIGLKMGDVLTLPRGREVTAVRVTGFALRRGPAREAQALYETLNETMVERSGHAH